MKQLNTRPWLICGLMFILIVSCKPQPEVSPLVSPLSPVATPPSKPSEKESLRPEEWTPTTVGDLTAYYVEIQIYEPLAWTDIDWDGEYVWLANNLTHELLALDRRGEVVHSLPYPQIDDLPCNVTGVASAGERIWIADVAHRYFYALDRQTGQVLCDFEFTDTPQGMDWDGATLWVAIVEGNRLERRDEQGKLLAGYPLRGRWTTGVAWDGNRIWYVDSPGHEVWALDPASGRHEQQTAIGVLVSDLSFNSIAWAGDYLLLFNDMGGRLYAVPQDR